MSQEEIDNGYVFSTTAKSGQGRRMKNRGATETSPYIVLELLRELVNEAGVKQSDIDNRRSAWLIFSDIIIQSGMQNFLI